MTVEMTPVLSRRTINPEMAARGMRSVSALAVGKPCGTRMRYYAGCRCEACRTAASAYERDRRQAKARGEGNGLVSAAPARAHLTWLSASGVGRVTAADAAKVASTVVELVISGKRLKIRAQTERRILAVTVAAAADRAYIDAAPTWKLVDALMASGYSRTRLASEIAGRPTRSLQLRPERVTARNAELVRQVHARLCIASPKQQRIAQQQLTELRDECYRVERIQREVNQLAEARGWPAPCVNPQPTTARWAAPAGLTERAVTLIGVVHAAMAIDEVFE